ncbi:MAG: prepilin-type N-terminal cleavage/methylation domain-containing protein [Acetatifactor sp.]|nr:prepilin-type N-terminal cleavage/methylation domain-containing protein [Acetatifactor sp.]
MKNEKKMNNKGFSLVELIIVIAIMAVLIAVLAPQYMRFIERGRAASDRDNVKAIVGALQVHGADTQVTNALASGTITLQRGSTAAVTDASYTEALTNAGIALPLPALTNQSTFSSVTITITVNSGTYSVIATENT